MRIEKDFVVQRVELIGEASLHWCLARRDEIAMEQDADSASAWLSAPEREELATLRGRRATDWLAGRTVAKQALVAAGYAVDQRDLAILSLDARGQRNRPEVFVNGQSSGIRVSLAHTENCVAVAWTTGSQEIGIDLADLSRPTNHLADAWFTAEEQATVAHGEFAAAALRIWTAKEAAYKAAQNGEAFDPLRAQVTIYSPTAGTVTYRGRQARSLRCEVVWREVSGILITLSKVCS